jgi:hypothetical protein
VTRPAEHPVEGGAAAASVVGSAAALVEAVAAAAAAWEHAGGAMAQAARLRTRATVLGEQNRRAHRAAAQALAAGGDPELGARLEQAAMLPLAIAEAAADAAALAAHVASCAEPDIRPDAVVAACLAHGAAAAAAHLVAVNLAVSPQDPRLRSAETALGRARDAAADAVARSA